MITIQALSRDKKLWKATFAERKNAEELRPCKHSNLFF